MHRTAKIILLTALVTMFVGTTAGAGTDQAATANTAIGNLTAALPGLVTVPANNQFAAVPECDVAEKAETLASTKGEVVQQGYGGTAGGVNGRIVVFSKAKDAKRYYKLLTSARARVCIAESHKVALARGGDASAVETDLTRGTVPDVRPSTTFEGTIALGTQSIDDYEAYVRRGAVIIQLIAGVTTGSDPATRTAVEQWVVDTAALFE